ncbi:MAG: hypothetical protein ACLQKA_14180 [Bryobacteraceae bacterium]
MALETKRKIKELTDNVLPGRVKEIEEICGAPIPYEVDWASFGDDLEALNFLDNLSCHRLNMALRVICQDELGKEAVRESLKKVKLKNVAKAEDKSLAFSGGTLEMCCAYALRTEGMHSDGEIRDFLLAHL